METPMSTHKIRRKLPPTHSMEIGRIITRFAYAEHLLRSTVYRLLRISPKQGRITVRQPRAAEQITLIQDLSRLGGLKLTVDWKELKKTLRELEAYRNKLAHGIWVYHAETKTPVLQDLSGAYVDTGGMHEKPKINPISVVITLRDLRRMTRNIDTTIDYLRSLNRTVIRLTQETSP